MAAAAVSGRLYWLKALNCEQRERKSCDLKSCVRSSLLGYGEDLVHHVQCCMLAHDVVRETDTPMHQHLQQGESIVAKAWQGVVGSGVLSTIGRSCIEGKPGSFAWHHSLEEVRSPGHIAMWFKFLADAAVEHSSESPVTWWKDDHTKPDKDGFVRTTRVRVRA